jgi:PAS domain-containing protein
MALPALWAGGDPPQIVGTLLDALLGMLRLAFVFARVNHPEGGPPVEMVRVAESLGATGGTRQINAALDAFVPKWPAPARMCIGEVDLSVASARLGLQGEIGIIVAGSSRPDFPGQTERLLLDVAANQATIGLLTKEVAEHRRAAEALRERESRVIVDTIPGLVAILTAAGEVDVVNDQLVEYCGQDLEAMRQWGTNGTVHVGDLPRIVPVFTQAITAGEPYEFEARIRRFDGVYRCSGF